MRPELLLLGPHEHVVHECGMPGLLGDQPDRHPMIRIGPAERILDEQVLARIEVPSDHSKQVLEDFRFGRLVYLPPPDIFR